MSNKQIQFRRGTNDENNAFTGAQGELSVDTDNNELRLHDGVTQGGTVIGASGGGGGTVLTTFVKDFTTPGVFFAHVTTNGFSFDPNSAGTFYANVFPSAPVTITYSHWDQTNLTVIGTVDIGTDGYTSNSTGDALYIFPYESLVLSTTATTDMKNLAVTIPA